MRDDPWVKMIVLFYRCDLTYLLDFFFVSLLEVSDVIGTLLGFLDLLPSFHFLLLKKGNTIGQ